MNRFSIREILLVFVTFALAIGWWVDRRSGLTRYQMHVTTNHAFVLDTVNGEIWNARIDPNDGHYYGEKGFRDIKLPD